MHPNNTKEYTVIQNLNGKSIAILATHGFEQSELAYPLNALRAHGASVDVVSPEAGTIRGWDENDWGEEFQVDQALDGADPAHYDALVLPGGVINPDLLRTNADAIGFITAMADAGKPVAAICHGPWLLAEAGLTRGRKVTSYPSIKTDIANADGDWRDESVVRDGNIVTSRSPRDLENFVEALGCMLVEPEETAAA